MTEPLCPHGYLKEKVVKLGICAECNKLELQSLEHQLEGAVVNAEEQIHGLRLELEALHQEVAKLKLVAAFPQSKIEQRFRTALKDLMGAHREVFNHSLFTAFQAGKSNFQKAWLHAEEVLNIPETKP